MFSKPREAKRLFFDVIPRNVDDYLAFLSAIRSRRDGRLGNPVWHIHAGAPSPSAMAAANSPPRRLVIDAAQPRRGVECQDRDTLWGFIRRYAPGLDRNPPALDALVTLAIRYYEDFVRPKKRFKVASVEERAMLADLDAALVALQPDADAATIQSAVYEVGRAHFPDSSGKAKTPDGRPGVSQAFFQTLYRVLLGQERGPRFGSFVEIYGVAETRALIAAALAGELTPTAA